MTDTNGVTGADDLGDPARGARFGTFELDLRTGELRRDGVRVKLQDQPLRLLTFLLEHPGEIVTREELRERLWPAEFVDFDHSLNTAIRKLRTALDDSADNPRFVETLARRGYRFIAPVSWIGAVSPSAPPATSAESPPTPSISPVAKRRRPYLAAIVAVAVLTVALGVVGWRRHAVGQRRPISAIAVLPFTINDDAHAEHVSDGLTEILIDKLSRLPDLRVMARSTVFSYKGKGVTPAQAGQELDVGAVVTGQVRRSGERYTIHVEMIDVRDGAQLWGQQYDTTGTELPLIQGRISSDLTAQLRQIATGKPQQASRAYTASGKAYEHYLLGLYLWNQRGADNVRRSLEHFTQAIQLDPEFAAAYAGQANAYGVMVGMGQITPQEGTLRVLAAARKALELDPDNAEAYTSLATTAFRNLWDFAGADRDYRRAIALNPNYATAHQWYSDYLKAMGRWDEAWGEIEAARRVDPLAPAINNSMCLMVGIEKGYQEALEFAAQSAQLGRPLPHCTFATKLMLRDFAGIARDLRAERDPQGQEMLDGYQRGGARGLLSARLQWFLRQPHPDATHPVEIAEMYVLLDQPDEAFAWLEKGFQHRNSRMTTIHNTQNFDALRNDPRFTDLSRRIGLPAVAMERANTRARVRPSLPIPAGNGRK